MAQFPPHLLGDGPHNPFPGVKAIERRIGREISHRLGSNEGLDMPHRALRAHFGDAMVEHVSCYADAEALGVRQRLQRLHGFALDSLLVDAGADSLIALVLRAVVTAEECVVATAGTYPAFAYFARGHGCRLIETPYVEAPGCLAPDLDALVKTARKHRARLVYLANPDNPSGHLHDDSAVAALREALPEDCWLLLDEAYHDFRDDADSPFARRVLPGVIRLRTLSKAHGMAGMRVGYAIAEPETLDVMRKVRIHYAVSNLSLIAAEVVLDHPAEVKEHVCAVKERRQRLAAYFSALGAEVLPSATNFVAVRLPDAELAGQVHRGLLETGCLIAHPDHPSLAHILRISALKDALVPGRLALLEEAVRPCTD
ncbi:MAG TPA: aminotransferase class I/II-fold pyridoxal phosphate-dependent enzyme [Azoarcus sp.]|nr:aminotransferase class I/II-fold pyridoxal phosphate-dependent enzyme [Azoarcus sp.]